MRLAEFIFANIEPILAEWEAFARSLLPGANLSVLALRDDAESILRNTVRDMQNAQSLQQQASVLSYIDAFRTIAILALVCVPLVFLLRKATNASGPMAAH